MTYTEKDIKHLELMTSLAEQKPVEDEVIVDAAELSFDEKMLKLCNGLREKGLVKHAEELEQKFITYKALNKTAANTHIYRAHDEDGEDVINAAHPDPDPNMGDGDLGDVENIVSKHKKIVDVIQKQPTGKLGSYVQACKIVLSQAAPESPEAKLYGEAKSFLDRYIEIYDTISNIREGEKTNVEYFDMIKRMLNSGTAYKTENFPAILMEATENLKNDSPSVFSIGNSAFSTDAQQKWQEIQKYIPALDKYAKRFNGVASQIVELEKQKASVDETKEVGEVDPDVRATNKVNELIGKLKQYAPRLTRYEVATNYINTTVGELNNLLTTISQKGTTPEIDKALAEKEQEVNKFAAEWKLGG